MRKPIRKILFATDMSEKAREAYDMALDLAELHDAEITALFVMEKIPHMANMLVGDMLGKETWERMKNRKRDELLDRFEKELAAFCTLDDTGGELCRLTAAGSTVSVGSPYEEILSRADETSADLIVVGCCGWGGGQTGSTAKKVVSGSKIPVLVVK